MSRASKQLLESRDPEENAMGAYIHRLIDKGDPIGKGPTRRAKAKGGSILLNIPEITGAFRINVADPTFPTIFASRANL
jgi:hypothetical protein